MNLLGIAKQFQQMSLDTLCKPRVQLFMKIDPTLSQEKDDSLVILKWMQKAIL